MRGARAVLFDLDGVLIDSYEVWFHLLASLAEELGYPPVEREAFRAGWGQGIEADVRRFYPRHTVGELEALYAARFEAHLSHLAVMEGVGEVFAALRRRGLPSAVITNTPARRPTPWSEAPTCPAPSPRRTWCSRPARG